MNENGNYRFNKTRHNNKKNTPVEHEQKRTYKTKSFKDTPNVQKISSPLFSILPETETSILNNYYDIVQRVKPLNSKQFTQLPYTIRDLSHLLTDERPDRRTGYMNETVALSAYIRYFSWWNLIRLTRLFAALPKDTFSFLNDGNAILDIGSGPLTVPIALWIARPELRSKKLTCYCLDLSTSAMAVGEEIFLSIAARLGISTQQTVDETNDLSSEPWRIVRVKGTLGTSIRQKASLVTCANMFNELYWDSPKPLEELAKKYAEILVKYTDEKSSIFVAEPGVPRSSRFVSLLRDALIRKDFSIVAPCPHMTTCPMDGRKGGKWCHFVISTEDAPLKLLKLSKDAGIPKERATISFVFANSGTMSGDMLNDTTTVNTAKENPKTIEPTVTVRVVSDSIKLPYNKTGRYACSALGLTLVLETPRQPITSGSLVTIKKPVSPVIDQKTGAIEVML